MIEELLKAMGIKLLDDGKDEEEGKTYGTMGLVGEPPPVDPYRLVNSGIRNFYAYRALELGADRVLDRFMPNERDKLSLDNMRLENQARRLELGLPSNDDEYESMLNKAGIAMLGGSAASFGRTVAEKASNPSSAFPSSMRNGKKTVAQSLHRNSGARGLLGAISGIGDLTHGIRKSGGAVARLLLRK